MTKKKDDATWEELKKSLDQAPWSWLKPHAQRDAVIVVHPNLDLVEVGMKVASDESGVVKDWVEKRQLAKPTSEQMKKWDEDAERKFLVLIVQPYVLVQELQFH